MVNKLGILILLLVFTLVVGVAFIPTMGFAISSGNTSGSQGKDILKPASPGDALNPNIVYSSITQGQTNYHSEQIGPGVTSLHTDLYWGNPSNSLQLTIYSPDGSVYGPVYDSYDGTIDGQINVINSNPNGVAQGTWYFKVYGYSVTGTQSYSI